jgi:hypothetical protein
MGARNRVGVGFSYRPARDSIFKFLRSPGIDYKESIPPAHVAWLSGAQIFKRLRSPGIDSKESIPPAHEAWRSGTRILFLLGS